MRISDWSADVCSSDLPVGLVETVVASSGLSEAVPAAAPPRGLKARLRLAGFGAAMALGLIWAGQREKRVALLTHDKQGRGNGASGVSEMGFALSKLNWLSRDRRKSGPALRRADAHPDAPARSPIFSSDKRRGGQNGVRPVRSRGGPRN